MTAQEKSEAVSDVAKNELNTTNVNDDSSLQKVLSDSSEHSQYDSAYTFVQDVDDLEYEVSPKLLRKLDLRILTILCGIYFLHFLDKTLLNYAAAMGIKKNLANPNDFANLSTIFYASYIVGVPVVAYMLQKWSLSRTLGIFIILWGVVVAVHAACKNYVGLMLVRTFLGFLESSSAISLIVISGNVLLQVFASSPYGLVVYHGWFGDHCRWFALVWFPIYPPDNVQVVADFVSCHGNHHYFIWTFSVVFPSR